MYLSLLPSNSYKRYLYLAEIYVCHSTRMSIIIDFVLKNVFPRSSQHSTSFITVDYFILYNFTT